MDKLGKDAFNALRERGFIEETNGEDGVKKLLAHPPVTVYAGFDPSADSLHIGSLIIVRALRILQQHGHKVIFLLGGATGLVGDPTGKTTARKRLTPEEVRSNAQQIRAQMEKLGLLKFSGENAALMVNNYDWLSKFSLLEDFMVEIARHFSVNEMVKRTTFAKRLEAEENLSLLEFLYPILQAWDFLYLFDKYNCCLQVGGKDQWSNILEGVKLIKRLRKKPAFTIVQPLLETSQGQKMGKTEEGPLWLDPKKTSPFRLFQEIVGTPDELVFKMFKMFTDLPFDEISKLHDDLSPRELQERLAYEMTVALHGKDEADKAQRDAGRLFREGKGDTESIPIVTVPKGTLLDEVLVGANIIKPNTKSEIRRRCKGGAIQIGGEKISGPKTPITESCRIKAGKKLFLQVNISEG